MDNDDHNNEDLLKGKGKEGIESDIDGIDYLNVNLNEIQIKHLGRERGKNIYETRFDNKIVGLSNRFWQALGSRFQLNQKIFTYFTPEETLERVVQVHGAEANVRLAVEKDKRGDYKKLLSISSVDKNIVKYHPILELLMAKGGKDLTYNNGIVSGIFRPSSGEQAFSVGGDDFKHLYMASFPVDGYGDPNLTLALLRLVCSNGMVARSSAHTAKINLGKDEVMHGIERALDTYANEEGYDVLVRQIEKAQQTTASVAECNLIGKCLTRIGFKPGSGSKMAEFQAMCGNLLNIYGEASLDAISEKFQTTLPSRCKVYDLINFVTELATHHVDLGDHRTMQTLHGLTGTLLSGQYDLEGMETEDDELQDLFITNEKDLNTGLKDD